ncbi:MAG: nitroreductase family protein, partial [Lachnotalea sp.]
HFILSATEEGLGTCWIASLNENKVKEALSIPEEYRVVAMTPVGEIREDSEHYEQKDVRQYVFLDNYNNSYNYDKYNN